MSQSDWIETMTALSAPTRARRFLADCRGTDPETIVADDPERIVFLLLVDLDDETLASVAQWRYGLGGWPLLTLERIGAELDVSRQDVDQLLQWLFSAVKKRLEPSATVKGV